MSDLNRLYEQTATVVNVKPSLPSRTSPGSSTLKRNVCLLTFSVIIVSRSLWKYASLHTTLRLEHASLNVTDRFDDTILIFNRVPKAGTQTINLLIDKLKHRNNFRYTL